MPRINTFVAASILLIASALILRATPQIPDTLIYEGREYPIQNELLGTYFAKFPERNPKIEDERCSALWRGYRSVYEVTNRQIYLKDLFTGVCQNSEVSQLKRVLPSGERLAVDWFTGLLVSFDGNNDANPYSLESLDAWEKYSFFQVNNGIIEEVRHFDNKGYRKFKKLQFEAYKKTPDYADGVKKAMSNAKFDRTAHDLSVETWIFWTTKSFLVK